MKTYLGPVFGRMNPVVVVVVVEVVVVVVRRSAVCWPTGLAQDSWLIHRTRSGNNTPPFPFPRLQMRRWRPSSFRTSASPPRFPGSHFCVSRRRNTINITLYNNNTNNNITLFCIYTLYCILYTLKQSEWVVIYYYILYILLDEDYVTISIENSTIRRVG